MRTRLDEIVDQENAESFHTGVVPALRRTAERAFRHGVEQHRAAINLCNKVMAEAGVRLVMGDEAVQPAPAGEIKDEWRKHPAYDRRKGERRKNTRAEFLGSINGVYGGLYAGPNGGILANRRSGKDRRKG